jgi:hypothetical protein
MPRDLTASDSDDRLQQGIQQKPAEESDGHRLAGARERYEQPKEESRRRRGDCGKHEKPAGPAMKLDEPAAHARRELEWRQ